MHGYISCAITHAKLWTEKFVLTTALAMFHAERLYCTQRFGWTSALVMFILKISTRLHFICIHNHTQKALGTKGWTFFAMVTFPADVADTLYDFQTHLRTSKKRMHALINYPQLHKKPGTQRSGMTMNLAMFIRQQIDCFISKIVK